MLADGFSPAPATKGSFYGDCTQMANPRITERRRVKTMAEDVKSRDQMLRGYQSSENLRKGSQIVTWTTSGTLLPIINKGLNLKEKLFPCQVAEHLMHLRRAVAAG